MDDVGIVNMMLTKLGTNSINNLGDATENARKVNAIYTKERDALLRKHPWNFAVTRASLALVSATPVSGYTYQHQLPTDCLRVLAVYNGTDEGDRLRGKQFRIEGTKVLSENDTIYLKYIARVTDPNQFTMDFIETFVAKLQAELAYALTGDKNLAEAGFKLYLGKLSEAKGIDAQEEDHEELEANDWLDERI